MSEININDYVYTENDVNEITKDLESTITAQKKVIEGLEANLTREISIVDYQRTQIQNLDTLLNEQAKVE